MEAEATQQEVQASPDRPDQASQTEASQTEAALLDVAPGTPLLCVDRIGYTANNRPIETSRIVVRTDLYRPTITTRSR